ncbi:MAG: adenosylmethionine--8-amino-7-oxononanoate transaminase [Polyangiales bacterium]
MPSRDDILALDRRHVWRPYTSHEDHAERDPIVVAHAEGAWLTDVDGRRYLDGVGSWWTNNLGHRHPRLARVIREQTETLLHSPLADATHAEAALCAEALVNVAPRGLDRVFFSDDGSTGVEVALKIAHQYWHQNGRPERTRFVSFGGAYHGDTLGAMAVGGVESFRSAFGPLLFEAIHVDPPAPAEAWSRAAESLRARLKADGDRIAAVIVEPLVQGAAGMRMWPAELLREVRAITREADVFLLADEVFTGFGRTGSFWAVDQADVVPDLLVTAKGLSGGILPFAATLATERIYEGFRGGKARALLHGHTFCGNPLGARIAREVLAVYRDENVLEGIPERTARIRRAFESLPGARTPRALGMIGAADLGAGDYFAAAGRRVADEARRRGAYLRPLGDVVYVAPPLNISIPDLEKLLEILRDSVAAAASS